MAKRRILKKEISYVAGELFTEALVCKLYIPGVNQEKADALMARILDMQDSYIVRAGHPDGRIQDVWQGYGKGSLLEKMEQNIK